ncbi:MAG: PIN domain-containing protein [Syntrophorhabdales bacterium]
MIVDTNVVLDVLLARQPFAPAAAKLFALIEQSRIEAWVCATTVTTIDYLLSQSLPRNQAKVAVRGLLTIFEVALVNRSVLERALASPMQDFEDAVLAEAGVLAGARIIVTRNTRDFSRASLPALTPQEFFVQFDTTQE